jgi:hypothetical protein
MSWRRAQGGDPLQKFREYVARDCHLGHLERDVASVADDLRADLDQFLSQARERPVFDRIRRYERP